MKIETDINDAVEIKTEADCNNIVPSIGMFGFDNAINISVG